MRCLFGSCLCSKVPVLQKGDGFLSYFLYNSWGEGSGGTEESLTHSGFRICIFKGCLEVLWTKSGEGSKKRSDNNIDFL